MVDTKIPKKRFSLKEVLNMVLVDINGDGKDWALALVNPDGSVISVSVAGLPSMTLAELNGKVSDATLVDVNDFPDKVCIDIDTISATNFSAGLTGPISGIGEYGSRTATNGVHNELRLRGTLPNNIKTDANLVFNIHFSVSTTNTGNVRFILMYGLPANGDLLESMTLLPEQDTDIIGINKKNYHISFAIPYADFNGKEFISMELVRNADIFTINGVNQGAKTFTISGNNQSEFWAGQKIQVRSSTGNDGEYTLVSATDNGGDTDLVVSEVIPDGTVDGNIDWNDTYAGNVYVTNFFIEADPKYL